jgi:PRTRC genetic system protein E
MDGEQGGYRKALNTPLSIVATPEELDSPAFIETITRFTASVTGLRTNLDEAQAAHKAAAQSVSSAKGKKPEPTKQPEPPQPELPATAQAATPSLI